MQREILMESRTFVVEFDPLDDSNFTAWGRTAECWCGEKAKGIYRTSGFNFSTFCDIHMHIDNDKSCANTLWRIIVGAFLVLAMICVSIICIGLTLRWVIA